MSMKREVTQKVIEKVIPATIVKEIQEVETLVVTFDGPKDIQKNRQYGTWKSHYQTIGDPYEILSSFSWKSTPEGLDFWAYVEKRLFEIKEQLCIKAKLSD